MYIEVMLDFLFEIIKTISKQFKAQKGNDWGSPPPPFFNFH